MLTKIRVRTLLTSAAIVAAVGAALIVPAKMGATGPPPLMPIVGDFDGDGKADPTLYRPASGWWYTLKSTTNFTSGGGRMWGLSTDTPVSGDFDGDGKADPAVFRPTTGGWYYLKSSTNYATSVGVLWGLATDVPVAADYDGDGKADPAIYRPSTGGWYVLKSSTNYGSSIGISWGLSTDVPVPGDYDGDGKADFAIYRPSTGLWAILKSSTNYTTSTYVSWGLSTDVPVPGDYDGDHKTDPAIFRPSTGGWYYLQSSTDYGSSFGVLWGLSTDVPVPGDYDGDHKTDPAVYRPSTGGWYALKSSTNYAASLGVVLPNDVTSPVVSGVGASSITTSGAMIGWTTDEASDSQVEYGLTSAYGTFTALNSALSTGHAVALSGLAGNTVYHYRVRSRDASGNLGLSTPDSMFTTLENIPPTVSITAPAPLASVSATVTVTANAADNIGVVGVQFLLDGAPLGLEDMSSPYSIDWDTTTSPSGSHTLTAVARDAAGNRTTSTGVTVTVANTADVMLAWDANTEPTLSGYKVYVSTTSGIFTSAPIDAHNVTTFTVTGLPTGHVYYFVVTAYDGSGGESGWSNEVSASK